MAVREGFATYCIELLSSLGEVHGKRMFGGYGLYAGDVFVAIIAGETLYLKADDETRPRFEAAGCSAFSYDTKDGKRHALGFWTVPPEAMDSERLMQPWARLALDAALRAWAAPTRRRKR